MIDTSIFLKNLTNNSGFIQQLKLKQRQLHYLQYKIRCKAYNHTQDLYRYLTTDSEQTESINNKEIRIVGLRRSGNHAIIGWIEEQAKLQGSTYFLNNIATNENPYRYKYQNLAYHFPTHKWAIEQYKKQAQGNFISRDCLIYSYEDYPLQKVFTRNFEEKHNLYIGKSSKRYDVLIIRDPFNFIASRIRKNFLLTKEKSSSFVDLWIEYAKEYLNKTNYLKHNKLCINYNLWCQDYDYRRDISEKLNIAFTDRGLNKVRSFGGGSSFDADNFDRKASDMDLNNRWQYYQNHPFFLQAIDNQKLLDYSSQIFGDIPGTEALIK